MKISNKIINVCAESGVKMGGRRIEPTNTSSLRKLSLSRPVGDVEVARVSPVLRQ